MGDVAGGLTVDERAPTDSGLAGADATSSAGAVDAVDSAPGRPVDRAPRHRWEFWRSPSDQPDWARPALLVVAALALLSYGWGMGHDQLETFYGGAVRSMAGSWHDFFFGAFDPWGTVSVDKLPGALWVQALSVRLLGFHVWSIVLPQALEGVLTVLVLYRAVRRIGGPLAGLAAAIALAATPVTILLDRGNISDTLLVLLLVLGADAATKAFLAGSARSLAVAGLWVGLAFQTKMLQAWIVLPAIFVVYLVAAPVAGVTRRVGHLALCALVVAVASLSYMCVVSLVPAHDRPYADGSCDNSVFSQVFLYNGADRISGANLSQAGCSRPPVSVTSAQTTTGGSATVSLGKGPGRFLDGLLGRDAAWLFPAALVALVAIMIGRRKEAETDPWRAGALLWGIWLLFTWAFFASSHFLNPYYLAALAPPIAALCGLGLALAWRYRRSRSVVAVLMVTVAGGVAYALYLLPGDAGVRALVVVSSLLVGTAALVILGRCLVGRHLGDEGESTADRRTPALRRCGFGLAVAALLLGPAWASATAVAAGLGPFDSPYQPEMQTAAEQAGWSQVVASWPALNRSAAHAPTGQSVETVETSAEASDDILATGREFLPVGGFTGLVPSTPLSRFRSRIEAGSVQHVLVSVTPRTRNPDMVWAATHCRSGPLIRVSGVTDRRFTCTRADATG